MSSESIASVMHPSIQAGEGGATPTSEHLNLNKADWWVRPCSLERTQELVEKYHYAAGGSNTRVYTHGVYPRDAVWEADCIAVAWWIPPTKSAALAAHPTDWNGVLSLSRLVAVPTAPKNTCSFLIRHSMRQIDRKRWPCLLTFADEWQEHEGTIYKATGWTEAGWTKPERCYVKNGRMTSRKAGPVTRTHKQMLALGCVCIGSFRKKRFTHIV